MPSMNLQEAVTELKCSAPNMRLPDLRKLILEFKPKPGEIEPYIQFTESHYARNLVYRTPDFEVLVLCWRSGQRSPIHDHGDSICSVYTYDGLLSADNYRRLSSGHIRADYSEDFKPGTVLSIQTTEVHQVSNLSDSDLVSVHFYLGPLQSSNAYSVLTNKFEAYRPEYTRVFVGGAGI